MKWRDKKWKMFLLQKWFRIKPVTRAKVFENNLRTKIWKLVRTRILIFQLHRQPHPFLQIHKLSALPTPTRTMVWVRVGCVDPKPPSGVWVRPCFLSVSKFSRGQKLLKKQTDQSRLETTYHTPQLNSVRSEHTKHHKFFLVGVKSAAIRRLSTLILCSNSGEWLLIFFCFWVLIKCMLYNCWNFSSLV